MAIIAMSQQVGSRGYDLGRLVAKRLDYRFVSREDLIAQVSRDYNVTPEGKQFIALFPLERIQPGDQAVQQINVVLNWLEELQQRVPVK